MPESKTLGGLSQDEIMDALKIIAEKFDLDQRKALLERLQALHELEAKK